MLKQLVMDMPSPIITVINKLLQTTRLTNHMDKLKFKLKYTKFH